MPTSSAFATWSLNPGNLRDLWSPTDGRHMHWNWEVEGTFAHWRLILIMEPDRDDADVDDNRIQRLRDHFDDMVNLHEYVQLTEGK
jgi:hypothetical protein